MRALVLGASGLVGGALLRALGGDGVGTYRTRQQPGLRALDASDPAAVHRLLDDVRPDVIFFPVGNPNVDECERDPEQARVENLVPLRTTLRAAAGTHVVAYSSDYVFDGMAGPYAETATTSPLSVYGRLKVELEELVLASRGTVIRPASIFGIEPAPAKNFVLRLVASLRAGRPARVPRDQIGSPTFSDDLAIASLRIVRSGERGIWHAAGPSSLPRDEFARLIARVFALDEGLIEGVATAELAQVAPRPAHSGLLSDRYRRHFGAPPVRPVVEALALLRQQSSVAAG